MFLGVGLGVSVTRGMHSFLARRARKLAGGFYHFCIAGLIVLLLAAIIFITIGLLGYPMRWYYIALASFVAGLFGGPVISISDGKAVWKAIDTFEGNPQALGSLIRGTKDIDDLRAIVDVLSVVYQDEGNAQFEGPYESAVNRVNELFSGQVYNKVIKTRRRADYDLENTYYQLRVDLEHRCYLPRKWELRCPHCSGKVYLERADEESMWVHCAGPCERGLGSILNPRL